MSESLFLFWYQTLSCLLPPNTFPLLYSPIFHFRVEKQAEKLVRLQLTLIHPLASETP